MAAEETVKLRCNMSVHYAINTDYDEEIDTGYTRAAWDALSDDDRRETCDRIYEEFVWEQIDGGWTVAASPEEG